MEVVAMTSNAAPVRVVVVGAESTGKTTLCEDLANHYGIPFVEEFGRWYTHALPDADRYSWSHDDFLAIAHAQNRIEDDAALWIGPLLVCDTNSFVTEVFEEAYLGRVSDGVRAAHDGRTYHVIIITDVDTPFETDEGQLRNSSNRKWMHDRYCQWAEAQSQDNGSIVHRATGDRESRLHAAVDVIDRL